MFCAYSLLQLYSRLSGRAIGKFDAEWSRTNIRPPDGPPASTVKQPRSRGGLLKRFLAPPPESAPSVSEEVDALRPGADDYDGFNLLLIRLKKRNDSAWAAPEASILFNRPQAAVHKVDTGPGYHGLSNSPPDQPWPKVNKGKQRMERELADSLAQRETDEQLAERMVDLLRYVGESGRICLC